MHPNTTTNPQRTKRGFLSIFSTPQKERTPHHEYLSKILKLEEQVQILEFDKHQLKDRLKSRITKSIADQHHKNTTQTPKPPRKQPILNTLDYLPSLTRDTLEYVLGRGEHNNLIIQNLSEEPHLLIAGKTGSGKSVTLFNILASLLHSNTPKTLKISLIDPKILSFGDNRIKGSKFLNEVPSIGDNEVAEEILKNAYQAMMKRYKVMVKRGVKDYRKIGLHAHVIFIDEVFELLEGSNGKEILSYITRIASLGRAGGFHLVMATQSPRAKTLSGTLKANLEFIGHRMSNPTESKLIELLDAHKLKGKGDGLKVINSKTIRFQATYIDIEKDEIYHGFHPIHPTNPHAPKADQKQPQTLAETQSQNAYRIETRELKRKIIESMDDKAKIKPKSYFVSTTNREELRIWNKAINELVSDEILVYQNGKGYFCLTDYQTALSVVIGGGV